MSLQPDPDIKKLSICHHGGINHAELKATGLTRKTVLDFSVCVNPFMPAPKIMEHLDDINIEDYPDSESTALRQCLSEKLGISPDNILAGSGTTELIRLVALAYFRRGEAVLIIEPTYGEYEAACRIMGAEPVKHRAGAEQNFVPVIEETASLIRRNHPKGAFICNPNNPTGKYLSLREIETLINAGKDTLFVIDEAYLNFVDSRWSSIDLISRNNTIILRSMTKDYALAGIRLGYAVASREIIDNLRRVTPPWNVNTIAQNIGMLSLEKEDQLEQSRSEIKKVKQFLTNELRQLGFQPLPSETNFFLIKVSDAGKFREALLKQGILVRDCASFGLPEYVRIAPRTLPECQKLIAKVKELDNLDFYLPTQQN